MRSGHCGRVDYTVNSWIYYYPGLPKFLSNVFEGGSYYWGISSTISKTNIMVDEYNVQGLTECNSLDCCLAGQGL